MTVKRVLLILRHNAAARERPLLPRTLASFAWVPCSTDADALMVALANDPLEHHCEMLTDVVGVQEAFRVLEGMQR